MPYDGFGNWVNSKTDLTTDMLGFGEIGGVGQLVYKLFRFKKYEVRYVEDGRILACPICRPGYEVEFNDSNGMTGASLLAELYNLAKKINDSSEEKPFDELIIEWCQRVAHPYFVDELSALMADKQFDFAHDYSIIEKDGIFDVKEFMRDLGKFYQVASYAFALDMIMNGYDDTVFNLAEDGRCFEGVPFLEKYKGELPETDGEKDYTPITPAKLLKEMKKTSTPIPMNSQEEGFARVPFDDYEELRDKLIDMIPDFRLRLKVNHKSNRVVLAADIHSVFDIAWYTLAKKVCEDAQPLIKQDLEQLDILENPVLRLCPICGQAFVCKGKGSKRKYCGSPECNKRRVAQNVQNHRKKKKIVALQTKGAATK